jgi:trehalose/maltose hydrolase-like predicted phosphorylase
VDQSGRSASPISPPAVTDYLPSYLPAYLSNGLIGLRIGRIPLLEGNCIVNGLVELDPVEDGEGFAQAPYPLAGDVEINGCSLGWHPELVGFVEQAYDFSCGELRTQLRFQAAEVAARIEVLTFCSRSLPTLVLKEMVVEIDRECDLRLAGGLDHTQIHGQMVSRRTTTPGTEERVVDGLMEWETRGGLSTCGVAYTTSFGGADNVRRWVEDVDQEAPLSTSYALHAEPGRRYVLRQITSLLPSALHSEPDRQATRMAFLGTVRGFDTIRRENGALWAELWKGRVRLVGADQRWQGIVDASYYYLHASAHRASLFSTSMFGLAAWRNYHYYRGHVMWDIEAFALPVFILTQPDVARAMLDYRLRRQDAARRNAAMNGYAGLQFPWAGSPVHGEEVIRLSAPRIIFEQHVNMSVAYAFARFVHATGDVQFERRNAWPVVSGVASWIEDRVLETERGYEIRQCIGIAEQGTPVDNNAYVNMAAAVVLREAAAMSRRLRLGGPAAERWEHIAERIFLPVDEESGVILNHEGYRYAGDVATSTPEALAGLFPLPYQADQRVERATLQFYLDRVGPYVGYPMLSAPMGVWAAWLGDRALSARLFEEGYGAFIDEPWRVANEFSSRFPDRPRAGPLVANVGGFLTGCLYGLSGLVLGSDDPERWPRRPVVMPELWEAVEVDRLWVRGRPIRLVARHGDARARIEPIS